MSITINEIVGAKWWKFDFHSHTPASIDYGKGSNQAVLKNLSPREWLLKYMQAEIDCVAVTDHNTGKWIDALKEELQKLISEKPQGYRPLYIFPGVELSVHGGIHTLAIFPIEYTTHDITKLLGSVGYKGTDGDTDDCTELALSKVIDEIHKAKGIAIPAHTDKISGLFEELEGVSLINVLDNSNLIAIETIDRAYTKPEVYNVKKLNLPEVIGSDAHHPEGSSGNSYIGSAFTWVKMAIPSFQGLTLALLDGKDSIKRHDECADNPNLHSELTISAIEVKNAKYLGRGGDFVCNFNPWLNTIIGGRGTGKSTVAEFLRIALHRQSELPQQLKNEYQKYSKPSHNRNDEYLMREETILRVYFHKDTASFRINWHCDSTENSIQELLNAEWVNVDGDVKQRFPVRIYSQKQIFELARNPETLLKIIDDAPEVDYQNWEMKRDELESQYSSLSDQVRLASARLKEESALKGQLADVKRKIDTFEKSQHEKVLAEYKLRTGEEAILNSWSSSLDSISHEIKGFTNRLHLDTLEEDKFSLENGFNDFKELLSRYNKEIGELKETLLGTSSRLEQINIDFQKELKDVSLSKAIEKSKSDYKSLQEELSALSDSETPFQYQDLIDNQRVLDKRILELSSDKDLSQKHQSDLELCFEAITEHRSILYKRREQFLSKVLEGNVFVKIDITPFGAQIDVESEFRKLIRREQGGFDRDINFDDGVLSLLKPNSNTSYIDLKKCIEDLHNGNQPDNYVVKDVRFSQWIESLSPQDIDRLSCWFPDDGLDIKYSLKGGRDFRPVAQGSPGQKTAALLAFIFAYGDEPLILDQPEDDLENQLIYDLIVNQMREVKKNRQILVVTHNANIVVNGDAENVIVLGIREGLTRIVSQGSLQEVNTREAVCEIMEGGQEAFNKRYKRMNINIST